MEDMMRVGTKMKTEKDQILIEPITDEEVQEIRKGSIKTKINDWQNEDAIEEINRLWTVDNREAFYREQVAEIIGKHYIKGETLLECGCGSGMLYDHLAPMVRDYMGLDISLPMLALFKAKHKRVLAIPGSIYDIPFPDKSFDVVIAIEVLGHLLDIPPALKEICRVTKKKAMFTLWSSEEPSTGIHEIRGIKFTYVLYKESEIHDMIQSAFGVDKIVSIIPLVKTASKGKSYTKFIFTVEP